MDLIYTDVNYKDVGVMKDYAFDLAYGADENDFELTIDLNNHCCEAGCLIYIEGTEYGGIIDGLSVVSSEDKLSYKGRSWQGVLASKVVEPDDAGNPLVVSGDANTVIDEIIKDFGFDELFIASPDLSGLSIDNYAFDNYVDVYTGIIKMLDTVSGKLKFSFTNNRVLVFAEPIVDYSKDEQFDNDKVEMEIEKTRNTVNHLIFIGKPSKEDEESTLPVVHLYKNKDGIFNSDTKTFTGIQEIMSVHEYSKEEDLQQLLDDLSKGDTKSLESSLVEDKVQLNLTDEDNIYDVGDIIAAYEIVTGTYASQKIVKKIVTINQGEVNIQYKVGE